MTARVEETQGTGLFCVVDDTGPVEEINAFLRAVTTRGLSPLTVRAYAFDLVAAYRWMAAAGRPLSELTRADLHDFVAYEQARGAQPNANGDVRFARGRCPNPLGVFGALVRR